MDRQVNLTTWMSADAYVTIVFERENKAFSVLQYPGRNAVGDTAVFNVALHYKADDGNTYKVVMAFNVTFTNSGTDSYTIQ